MVSMWRFLIPGVLVGSSAFAGPAATYQLRLKALDEVSMYRLKTQDRQLQRGKSIAEKAATFETEELLGLLREDDGEGALEVEVRSFGKHFSVNGKRVEGLRFSPRIQRYVQSPQGRRLDPEGGAILAKAPRTPSAERALLPRFPEGRVSVGHEWNRQVPATAGLPVSMRVVHTFTKVEACGEDHCAVIRSRGRGQGIDKAKGVAMKVVFEARLLLNLEAGLLVKSMSKLRFDSRYSTPSPEGFSLMSRRLQRRMALEDGASLAVPSSPDALVAAR